jgi:hypothetical protein
MKNTLFALILINEKLDNKIKSRKFEYIYIYIKNT